MWRTVIINQGERITIQNGNLHVFSEEMESLVPLADIYAVVIDNRAALISVQTLAQLSELGAHVYYCNEKHVPVGVTVPLNPHFRPLAVLKKQFGLSQEMKDALWGRIVKAKIENQARCLRFAGVDKQREDVLLELAAAVTPGDIGGCEAIAAKKYFASLFGFGFVRRADDVTNAALNYGYTILRSSICKTLVAYGYNCVLGLHHCSEKNEFNLADDLMEPFRPIVDLWVDENCENLFEELTKSNRKGLIGLLNMAIMLDGKRMRVRNAIDACVSSLTSALEKGKPSLLKLPVLLPYGEMVDEDE